MVISNFSYVLKSNEDAIEKGAQKEDLFERSREGWGKKCNRKLFMDNQLANKGVHEMPV